MARLHYVKKARKDNKAAGIKKGDSYWWWKFNYGAKQCSKTHPPRSALTRLAFKGTLWDTEDSLTKEFEDFRTSDADPEDLKSSLESAADEIVQLGEEQGSNRENMPEQLQDSGSGELLQSRADACKELADALRSLADAWDDEPDDDEPDKDADESTEKYQERMNEWQAQYEQDLQEWRAAIADTITEVSFDIE